MSIDYDIHGKYACFYGGKLSQWYRCKIQDNDIIFNCAEQAMMYRKAELFNDTEMMARILKADSPKEQKALGRKVKKFVPTIWAKYCTQIVHKNNLLKFSQNNYLKNILLNSGNLIFVECSPYDTIWGIGRGLDWPHLDNIDTWRGQNLLGYEITSVRDEIRELEKNK